jgi:hypothetical protein
MKAQKFPVRLHGKRTLVAINLPEPMGGSAKVYLRNVAKSEVSELYNAPIEIGISGRTDTGEEIPINTVGRWLFGTPGYMGHVTVFNWEGHVANVEFPKDSPSVVHELIRRLKAAVEGEDYGQK